MPPARLSLLVLSLSLVLLPGCAPMEPINGCALAAANRREVLRARAYLHPSIPARILSAHFAGAGTMGHALLVYRLDEGWCAYDDTFGTRQLPGLSAGSLPDPLAAARAACYPRPVDRASWYR